MAANQLRSRGSQARTRTGARECWDSASTLVMAGVWACRSWLNEAAVKKIEPAKYVTLSAVAPTALTYAGTDPKANNAEPMMNRLAIAALRATGRIVMQLMLSVHGVDQVARGRVISRSPLDPEGRVWRPASFSSIGSVICYV